MTKHALLRRNAFVAHSNRTIAQHLALFIAVVATGCSQHDPRFHDDPSADPLTRLKNGNARFVRNESDHPHADRGRRLSTLAHGQHPYAVIVGCSDSRVPVEILFDVGIGDLFVVRVAGNVCDSDETGSIEYAVAHLHAPLIVVLGHDDCGAVTAACHHAEEHGSIPALLSHIEPAVARVESRWPQAEGGERIALAVRENVRLTMAGLLKDSETVRRAVEERRLRIVGGVYNMHSAEIEWLDMGAAD